MRRAYSHEPSLQHLAWNAQQSVSAVWQPSRSYWNSRSGYNGYQVPRIGTAWSSQGNCRDTGLRICHRCSAGSRFGSADQDSRHHVCSRRRGAILHPLALWASSKVEYVQSTRTNVSSHPRRWTRSAPRRARFLQAAVSIGGCQVVPGIAVAFYCRGLYSPSETEPALQLDWCLHWRMLVNKLYSR